MNSSIPTNIETYNIFAICQDFRQRIKELNRLKEEIANDSNIPK